MTAEIWRHLGIPETFDESEIRRAYAERLKSTNPEDDPEGFKRLRNAYERAMQEARWRAEYGDDGQADEWSEDDENYVEQDYKPARLADMALGGGFAARPAPTLLPEPDPELQAHDALSQALEQAVAKDVSPWEVQAAFKALVASPAMERLNIYAATEMWIANLIRRYSGGGPLFEYAITQFKWNARSGDLGTSMLDYREALAGEAKAREFLTRVKDRRHEFHAAYKEVSKPIKDRSWLSKLLAFPRIDLVRRFLDYVEDKVPHARRDIDWTAENWWRKRINFWITPLAVLNWVIPIAVVIGVIALFAVLSPPAEISPERERIEARASCTRVVERPNGIGAVCDHILRLAPDSLLMRQYAGVIALREGRWADAQSHFEQIAQVSPVDPVARYGLGMALTHSTDAAEQTRGTSLMREALAIDDTVSVYFAQYGVPSPSVLDPAEGYEPFPVVRGPAYDTNPGEIALQNDTAFADAYAHFGIAESFGDGRVMVHCIIRASGEMNECRIMEETPRNGGRGEMAIRVMQSARVTPPMLDGQPVDGVPIRVPVTFKFED